MKQFKDFNIKALEAGFVGDKIHITRILNRQVTVVDYKIENSKFGVSKKCLCLQIKLDDAKRIVFSGSRNLINAIEQIPKTEYPFLTTIIEDNKRLEFT